MLLENLKNPSKITSRAPKNAPKIHLGTLPETRPEKKSLIALKGSPKTAQNAPQNHQKVRLGTQLMHFYGQNAAIESITVFKHIFERFLVLF